MSKPKLALYWAATCGGCDVAVLDTQTKVLDLADAFDIVLWPIAIDFKYSDIERLPEKSIDVCLFNGAVRNAEQEHLANVLRKRSGLLVAFGSCACGGGIPGLANATDRQAIFARAYRETPSTVNPDGVEPATEIEMPEGVLTIPEFYDSVRCLDQVVNVDYYVPGCPPTVELIGKVVDALVSGELPPLGSVVAADKTVCDECPREPKENRKVKAFRPLCEATPNAEECFLDQGIVCCGPATRAGCGATCPLANAPCRGCFGPPPATVDQGLKLLSAVSSVIDAKNEDEIEGIVDQIQDPLGLFYRFGLPRSLLHRKRKN